MAELQTLARPYARAVFELAVAQDKLADWSEILAGLAAMAANEAARPLLANPGVSDEQLVELFVAALGGEAPEPAKNLVRLLVDNGRLTVLPELARLYGDLRATHERRRAVSISTASEVDDTREYAITSALRTRLGAEVEIRWNIDPELIGGALIEAGDLVIDGSVRGELERLRAALTH